MNRHAQTSVPGRVAGALVRQPTVSYPGYMATCVANLDCTEPPSEHCRIGGELLDCDYSYNIKTA